MRQHTGSSLTAENHPARMPAVQRLTSSGDWAPCAGVSLRDGRETESQPTDLSGSVLRGLRETLLLLRRGLEETILLLLAVVFRCDVWSRCSHLETMKGLSNVQQSGKRV